ncbi:TATA-box-binding protein [Oryzias melastigma]|uniref:TATA-box-binding protein n=1 Tax=Oryzias melastigma TaxID=30732 RepID=A0A834FA46_ORYME|nr:TATA-box-binding protein [Oryzias melastigma]
MSELHFDAFYPMDDEAVENFYLLFVENATPKGEEEEVEGQGKGHPEGQTVGQREGHPEVFSPDRAAVKLNKGGCGPAHPPAPEGKLHPTEVGLDGGMSRLMPDGADDLPLLCIRNVVSIADLGSKLDLALISQTLWNTEHKATRPLGLLMRIRRPRTTANIFRSGKMICTGATSMEECRQATRRHARILQKAGFPVRILNFRIINCVCTVKTFPMDLEGLVRSDPDHFWLEPELCTSALYRPAGSITVTIHRRGTIVLMGSSSLDGYKQLLKTLYPMLKLFRQDHFNKVF